jgi:hypothetical protein
VLMCPSSLSIPFDFANCHYYIELNPLKPIFQHGFLYSKAGVTLQLHP